MHNIFHITLIILGIIQLWTFVQATDYTCKVEPPLPENCGCYNNFIVNRPNCQHESLYWCSSSIICNTNDCTGSIEIGSLDYCKSSSFYGRLLLQEVENCGKTGANRKLYAYIGNLNGENYHNNKPSAINLYLGNGLFSISSTTPSLIAFYINKNLNRLMFISKGTRYYPTANTNDCTINSWVSKAPKVITNGIIADDGESYLINGCTCQYITEVTTPSPTSLSPTTLFPTTKYPTTRSPTTKVPTTLSPTNTLSPTTPIPTSSPQYPSIIYGPVGSGTKELVKSTTNGRYYILESDNGLWRFGLNEQNKMTFWKKVNELWIFDHYLDTYKSVSGSLTAIGNIISIDYTGNLALIVKSTKKISWETGSSAMNTNGNGACSLSIGPDGTIFLTRIDDSFIYWNSRQPISRTWSNSSNKYQSEYLFLKNENWELYFGSDGAFHLFLSGIQKWISPVGSYFKFQSS